MIEKIKETTYQGLARVRLYGIVLAGTLVLFHVTAFLAVQWVETNEVRNELIQWSDTLVAPGPAQPSAELHLPQDIIVLHVNQLEKTGFYETRTDRGYLAYANPKNNYILAKSKESIEHETNSFAVMLTMLLAGDLVLLLGWWRFTQSKVRELFEVV